MTQKATSTKYLTDSVQVQFAVLFQHPHQFGQIRDQALAANPVGGAPTRHQGLLHHKDILARTPPLLAPQSFRHGMIEQAQRVFTMIAGTGDERCQNTTALLSSG